MTHQCFQAVFPEVGRCDIRERELPEPGVGEALIRIEKSLISPGTETVIFTGRHSLLQKRHVGWPSFPFLPGYSAVGRVQALGDGMGNIQPGDRVFVDATHATHAIVSAGRITPVPKGLPAEHAVFAGLGAIALNGVRMAGVGLDDAVVVAGLGLVGLLAARLAKLAGALPLLTTDFSAPRRALGTDFGADQTLDPACENVAEAIKAETEGRGADIVIEATGVPRVVAECLGWPRRGGRVVLLGSPHGRVEIDFYSDLHARNLQVIGAHVQAANHSGSDTAPWTANRNLRAFLTRVHRGDIRLEPLITRRISPADLETTYQAFADTPTQNLGVIVDWTTIGDGF